jgi:hypothetical protein
MDLTDRQIISTILNEINWGEERDRKRQAFDAYQVYSGNLKTYVEEQLSITRPKSWRSYTISNISLSKMVVNKIAKAYDAEPQRAVVDKSGLPNQQKSEKLSEWYNSAHITRVMKELDQITNLQKHALLWLDWREEEMDWNFLALAPYEYSLVRNKDTGAVQCVVLSYPDTTITSGARSMFGAAGGDGRANLIAESQVDSGGQSRVYAMWTDTQHVVVRVSDDPETGDGGSEVKYNITYVPIDNNPDNINPLGVLPFVYVTKDNSVDNPTFNPVTEQTITFNSLWSELLTAANVQGTSIFTLSYPASMQGNFEKLTSGITTGLELPQKEDSDIRTEADYISPNPDLANQREVYLNYLRMVLAEHGITNAQGIDGTSDTMHPSALDRIVANADTQNIVYQNQQCLYEPAEKQMFKIMKAWAGLLGDTTFSDEDELVIKYPKPKILISDKETLENIEKRLNMGLMEDWEALVAIDPNLTETEARQKIEVIRTQRMERLPFGYNKESNPESQGRSEREMGESEEGSR